MGDVVAYLVHSCSSLDAVLRTSTCDVVKYLVYPCSRPLCSFLYCYAQVKASAAACDAAVRGCDVHAQENSAGWHSSRLSSRVPVLRVYVLEA